MTFSDNLKYLEEKQGETGQGGGEKIEIFGLKRFQQLFISNLWKMPNIYKKLDDGRFECVHCGQIKIHQSTMYYHYQREHNTERNFSCNLCNFNALTRQILDQHIAARHPTVLNNNNENQHECPYEGCEFSDIRKGNLITHFMRAHMVQETSQILERRKADDGSCILHCKVCEESKKSMGSFLYHSITCITLSESDPRFNMLVQIL
jgi:transcription elongation factor Elf1